MTFPTFPPGFLWGAATASYQIEGAVKEDGRGPSIWDDFSHTPGKVVDGDTGDVAVDHYHRYRDDVALMKRLGLSAYRFSVAWSRVQPEGRGPVNEAGLDFYRRLVDELIGKGIEPWITLYHWDLPSPLEQAGGWPVRDTAERFAEYASIMYDALGDRVRYWTTFNEPWCTAFLGYASGVHAPGRQEPANALRAVHHTLLGHGLATRAIRDAAPEGRPLDLGITLNLYAIGRDPHDPDSEGAHDAARRVDGVQNRIFLDPILKGRYPEDVIEDTRALGVLDGPDVKPGDLDLIAAPIDVLGVNYYTRAVLSAVPDPQSRSLEWVASEQVEPVLRGLPVTAMNWEVDPGGLLELLERLHREYPGTALAITENGSAWDDVVSEDGAVHDPERVAYLVEHLEACREALGRGVPLLGYFAWSLLDNFEWAFGYGKRFGITHVDYETQVRTPKDSALAYARIISGDHSALDAVRDRTSDVPGGGDSDTVTP